MRVIGGEFRSRRLKSLPGQALRPTPDLLRQALFNVLAPSIEGATFLDAYAGSGAVGIEALSRGAAHATFIEKSPAAVRVINDNLSSLGIASRATVVTGSAVAQLARHRAGIVFLDPPYRLEGEYRDALDQLGENPPPLVLVQHDKRFRIAEQYGRLRRDRVLAHGDNVVSFLIES